MTKGARETYIIIEDGRISAGAYYYAKPIESETTGGFICNIPAYDIHFYAKDQEQGAHRAKVMIKAFLDHWLKHETWRAFILEVHKLGFRAENHNYAMKQLLDRQSSGVRLSSPKIGQGNPMGEIEIAV